MVATPKQDAGNSLDLVDIQEIKQSTVTVKDGSFRQVIMVGGVNFSLKSETEQNVITQGYQTFLNGIDFPLQILIHSRKVNIDKYIQTLTDRREVEQSPLLRNQIDEYAKFVQGFVEKNAIMEKVFLVVVSFYPTSALPGAKSVSGVLSIFGKKKTPVAETVQRTEEASKLFSEGLAQLSQRTTQVKNGLLNIGLEATVLDDEQLIELYYNFYNPQTIEHEKVPVARE
jgi:type IV secretory pathway VirB4 component